VSSADFVVPVRGRRQRIWSALVKTYDELDRHNYLYYAGSLSFFFLLSLFPLMIFLTSLFAYLPIPHLSEQTLAIMGRIVPAEAMGVMRGVTKDVLRTNPKLLSFGIAWAVVGASGAFNALIIFLNIAYDVRDGRPYWKTRLLACGLTLLTGTMVLLMLVVTVHGPEFGNWIARYVEVNSVFALLWPIVRWLLIVGFAVVSVEMIYFFGPNVKLKFRDQIPGALIAVSVWIAASWGLGWYLRQFAHYAQTFGTLGAVIGLMLWFYITALALMLGAEINAELLHAKGRRVREASVENESRQRADARRSFRDAA